MERGAGASNLHMRFNLNYVTPGHVMLTKELTGAKTPEFDLVEYPYQIFYKESEDGTEYLLKMTASTLVLLIRIPHRKSITDPHIHHPAAVPLMNPFICCTPEKVRKFIFLPMHINTEL